MHRYKPNKNMKELYSVNYKTMLRDIKNVNKWGDIPC